MKTFKKLSKTEKRVLKSKSKQVIRARIAWRQAGADMADIELDFAKMADGIAKKYGVDWQSYDHTKHHFILNETEPDPDR